MSSSPLHNTSNQSLTLPHIAAIKLTFDIIDNARTRACLFLDQDRHSGQPPDLGIELATTILDTTSGAAGSTCISAHSVPATLDIRTDLIAYNQTDDPSLSPLFASYDNATPSAPTARRLSFNAEARVIAAHHDLLWIAGNLFLIAPDAPPKLYARSIGTFMTNPTAFTKDDYIQLCRDWLKQEPDIIAAHDRISYRQSLGLQQHDDDGDIDVTIPFKPSLIGNPGGPNLHGGVVAAILHGASETVMQRCEQNPDQPMRSISHNVTYLRPGTNLDTYAKARIIRNGRRSAVVTATTWQQNPDTPIATSQTVFHRALL